MSDRRLDFVDLFAGAGGLSLGLETAGFDSVHAVEIDEDARSTYAENRDEVSERTITGDIREIGRDEIKNVVGRESVELVAGGPPCQGFSEVISPDGSDERNHLFKDFVTWVDELQPEAALFENVRGIENTADGKFLRAVETAFDQIGYDVAHRVVRASDFGVPQHRRRLVMVATRSEVTANPLSGFELDPVRTPGVIHGIGDLPEVGPGESVEEYDGPPETVLQRDLRGDSERLSSHRAANHTSEMVEMISHIPDGGDRTAIPDRLQPSSGYHNSYSRLQSDAPAVAITSNMSKPSSARCIHPFQDRGLTPREGARLQTFPDEYRFNGGLVSRRQQIGNAVPPYLAEALGYYLKKAVYDETLSDFDRNRIKILRCGALSVDEFKRIDGDLATLTQQATLDSAG